MLPSSINHIFVLVTDAENALDMPVMDDFDRITTARHAFPAIADVDLLLTGADNKYQEEARCIPGL